MKRFLSLCVPIMALGLTAVAHADSTLVSGNGQAVGTQVSSMNVTGFGLGAGGVSPYVVAVNVNPYSTILNTQWVSPTYSSIDHYAVQVAQDTDFTFTQSFFTLGSFHVSGTLLSDNNLLSAYLDTPGNPLVGLPSIDPLFTDQNSYFPLVTPIPFSPTVGTAGTNPNHKLVFVIHNQANNTDLTEK